MNPRILRLPVFVGLAAYILLAPAWRVVTGERHPAFKAWMMYSSVGADMCRVEYFAIRDGEREPVDRLESLGFGDRPWWKVPKAVRRLGSVEEVEAQGRRLCRALGRGTDLRADAWCGSRTTWRHRMKGDENLCPQGRGKSRPVWLPRKEDD